MAHIKRDCKVGDVVYESYTPSKLWVVTEIVGRNNNSDIVKIKNSKGIEKSVESWYYNDYDALIEDHRKKYENHIIKRDKFLHSIK